MLGIEIDDIGGSGMHSIIKNNISMRRLGNIR
jgi:hypothetical protein